MSTFTIAGQEIASKLAELSAAIDQAQTDVLKFSEPYIGKSEAARFLNISVTTLERRMAERDGPPRYTDGGKVSFRRSDLHVWRRQWRVGDSATLDQLDKLDR